MSPEEIYVDDTSVYITWGRGGYLEIGPEGVVGIRFAVDGMKVWPLDDRDYDDEYTREELLAETKDTVRDHLAVLREAIDDLEESL